jgi:hypothetical protein
MGLCWLLGLLVLLLLSQAEGICLRGAFWLCHYGVGLSLISYWSISVAPVRGGTYFSLPPRNYSALVNCYQAVHSEGHDEDAGHQGPDTRTEGRTHR